MIKMKWSGREQETPSLEPSCYGVGPDLERGEDLDSGARLSR